MQHRFDQFIIKSYQYMFISFTMYLLLFQIEQYVYIHNILYYKIASIHLSTYFLSICALIVFIYNWINILLYIHESKLKYYFLKISLLKLTFIIFIITIEAYNIYSIFKLNISIIIKILISVILVLFITEFVYIIFSKLINKNIFEQSFTVLRYSILIIIVLYAILYDAFETLEIFYVTKKSDDNENNKKVKKITQRKSKSDDNK